MAKTDFRSVDEYIASQPEAVQGILERVRRIIRNAVPSAEEVISYKIPAYKLLGGPPREPQSGRLLSFRETLFTPL
jgi:hypothetical protein